MYDSDSDMEFPASAKRTKHSTSDQETKNECPTYACPFLKKQPHKHRDCAKYVFKRVRDVKQHLNRSHRTPDFYCARCYDVFPSAKDRDEHMRDIQCPVQPNRRFEGITEEQKELLMLNKGRNKSNEEQWFLMWEILFPGTPRPTTVYRCNPREEAVVLLRGIWNTRRREFLGDVKPVMAAVGDHTINTLMEKIFDRLEWEVKVPNPPVRKPSKPMARSASSPGYTKLSTGDAAALPWEEFLHETKMHLPSPPYEENSIE